MRGRALATFVALTMSGISARADEPEPFVLLDRMTPTSRAGADVSLVFPRDIDVYGFRVDVHGQFVLSSHVGGYAHVGLTHVINRGVTLQDLDPRFGTPPLHIADPTAGTNLGFGALYALDLGVVAITFHAGGMLATSPTDWTALANLFTFTSRVSDIEQFLPGLAWLRGGAVVTGSVGPVFFQGDLSLSAGFATDDGDGARAFHVNGGMGTSLGPVRGMVEMANTMLASGGTSTWYHAVAFTGRFRDGAVSPHVSYVLPLDFRDGILGQTFVVGVVYVPAAR